MEHELWKKRRKERETFRSESDPIPTASLPKDDTRPLHLICSLYHLPYQTCGYPLVWTKWTEAAQRFALKLYAHYKLRSWIHTVS